ncbi:MAG: glycosyltransferase family 9 protein [Candidatus Omnitrophica bacterium]|nr:glycosyltransferase family 9 protein [Candidatus Omnitrophota bacterium]
MKTSQALVIRHGSLGDVILTCPVIQTLTRNGFQVTLAVREVWGKLLVSLGCGSNLLPLDSQFFLPCYQEGFPQAPELKEKLSPFQLILSFTHPDEPFSQRLTQLAVVPPLFHPVPTTSLRSHLIDYLLEPLKKRFDLIETLPKLSLPSSHPYYLVIHPGSGSRSKNWPAENFSHLVENLKKVRPIRILLGPAEKQAESFWKNFLPRPEIILSDDPGQLLKVFQSARLFIGNDSGVTHLAAALGVKTLAIFGPTDPTIWGPRGRWVRLLSSKISCQPCLPGLTRPTCFQECLRKITVEQVLKEVENLW